MLGNVSKSLPSVQYLLGGLSYLLGIAFCMVALAHFRENLENEQGGKKHHIAPYAYLLSAAMLLYLPTMMDVLSTTLFGSSTSVLQYAGYQPYDVFSSMTILVETTGLIWFIRGCVLISHASHPEQGKTGSKGVGHKGVIFVIAGLFAINFHSTVSMVDTVVKYLLNLTANTPS